MCDVEVYLALLARQTWSVKLAPASLKHLLVVIQGGNINLQNLKALFAPCKVKQASVLEAAQSDMHYERGVNAGFRACACSEVHEAGRWGCR
jgi:hypothetical protein